MTDVTEAINSNVMTMSDVFKKNYFEVPYYQRDYSWEYDQILDFWRDLMDVVDGHQYNHFFGQIVTYNTGGVKDLIDGQQRITTSLVFMAVIQNIATEILENKELTDEPRFTLFSIRKAIKEEYVMYDSANPALRLQPFNENSDAIHEYFIKLFHGVITTNDNNKDIVPVKNLQFVFQEFNKKIRQYLSNETNIADQIKKLQYLFTTFMDKFFISMISTANQEDAFVIFETLNSRGKDLSPSEIIKTHLMAQFTRTTDDVKEEAKRIWDDMASKFNKDSEKLTKFIRIYWAASHRLVPSNKLYRDISMDVKGAENTKKILLDLSKIADYYLALDSLNKTKGQKALIKDDVNYSILDLMRKMQVTLHYPIIFAMLLKGMTSKQMRAVSYKILCVFMRYRAICGYGTNKLEHGYASVAHKIWNQELTTPENINNEMDNKLIIGSDEVKGNAELLQKENSSKGKKSWMLKYLLFSFYNQQNNDFDAMSFNDANMGKYDIAHIDFDNINEESQNYIGNYVLIERDILNENDILNSLQQSKLVSNQKLGLFIKNNGWNSENIKARQKEFSESTVQVW
jgi:uncharacterized protein with ParB-like and HNH nuclease domain